MTTRPSLLLAAFPPELAGMEADPPAGWRVACTGVGALTAAVATARLLADLTPRRVLFVGTCGAYDERLEVGGLLVASEALALSLDVLEGRAYLPEIAVHRWPATLAAVLAIPFPALPVAVPPGITRTLEGARRLAGFAAVEHLELTGVFAACHAAGIPCGAALAVANRVGPDAHGEWLANHPRASRTLMAALRDHGVFQAP
ncbi:MAG: phosphorylase [Holophaga sp.]|nr:phosphorylase [Holophaga sp.]